MAYTSHSTPSRQPKGSSTRGSKRAVKVGRVVHVVLSLDDPRCESAAMVNAVYYQDPKIPVNNPNATDFLPLALRGNVNICTIPVVGEKVTVVVRNGVGYWTDIVPVNNHPHYNATPNTGEADWQNDLEKGFKELADINPLQANPGDFIIEGRYGQSIRIGGGKGDNNPIIDSSNEGKPIILISNGQIKTDNGNDIIREDINKDPNSLYFVADHKIPLQAANNKRDSYVTVPVAFDQYKGNQVILNGGRLVLNAKDDSILLSAKESIGLSSKTINLDAEEYMCVDASKIYIGKKARTAFMKEPLVLGVQLENWLNVLLDSLQSVATALTSASAVSGGPVTQLNTVGPSLQATVKSLRTQIKQFQSNKAYTE